MDLEKCLGFEGNFRPQVRAAPIAAWEDLQVQHDIQHRVIYVLLQSEDFADFLPLGFCDHDFGSGFEGWRGGFTGTDGYEVTGLQRALGNAMGSRRVRRFAARGGDA